MPSSLLSLGIFEGDDGIFYYFLVASYVALTFVYWQSTKYQKPINEFNDRCCFSWEGVESTEVGGKIGTVPYVRPSCCCHQKGHRQLRSSPEYHVILGCCHVFPEFLRLYVVSPFLALPITLAYRLASCILSCILIGATYIICAPCILWSLAAQQSMERRGS